MCERSKICSKVVGAKTLSVIGQQEVSEVVGDLVCNVVVHDQKAFPLAELQWRDNPNGLSSKDSFPLLVCAADPNAYALEVSCHALTRGEDRLRVNAFYSSFYLQNSSKRRKKNCRCHRKTGSRLSEISKQGIQN